MAAASAAPTSPVGVAPKLQLSNEEIGLPYMDVPSTAVPLFPSFGPNRKALLYIASVFYYVLRPGAPPDAKLLETYLLLTEHHLYLLDDDTACHRCLPLSQLVSVRAPKDVNVIKASIGKDLSSSRALQQMKSGCIFSFNPPEPDIYVGFGSQEEQIAMAKRLARIVKIKCPENSVQFKQVETVEECRPRLDLPADYASSFVEPASRPLVGVGAPTPVSQATKPSVGSAQQQPSNAAAKPPDPWTVLKPPASAQHIKVDPIFVQAHPPLADAAVRHVSRIRYFADGAAGWAQAGTQQRKGELGPMQGIAFVTDTHLYIAREGKYFRCIPLKVIKKILVKVSSTPTPAAKTPEGAPTPPVNRITLLVACMPELHDLLVDVMSKELASAIFQTMRDTLWATQPQPEVGELVDPHSPEYNFTPSPDYQLKVVPIPRRSDAPNYKARLVRFYEVYCPDKLSQVDMFLQKFMGNEAVMFENLEKKYGPEPPEKSLEIPRAASPSANPPPSEPEDTRTRLVRFYAKYCPEKVAEVDMILSKLNGRDEAMFQTLVKKYGPEPTPSLADTLIPPALQARGPSSHHQASPEAGGGGEAAAPPISGAAVAAGVSTIGEATDYRGRMIRFCARYMPQKVAHVDDALKKNEGREEQLLADLVKKYGPEPPLQGPDPTLEYRNRLMRFYYKYDPELVPTVDDALRSNFGREDEMIRTLASKYGPEPSGGLKLSTSLRLVNYCKRYFPDNLENVPKILEENKGDEELMFFKLTSKYGPEPQYPLVPHRDRLIAYAKKHIPSKVHGVDAVLAQHVGAEEALFMQLEATYGPEPPIEKTEEMIQLDRLVRFYAKYDPEKIRIADQVLARYQEREEVLFELLVSKFGPEPPHQDTTQRSMARDAYEKVDMTTSLAYADVPINCVTLFPSFAKAAIFWFSPAGYWQPPSPVQSLYTFLTTTHLYVASTERIFQRCVPISWIHAAYINSKKTDPQLKPMLLFKVFPREHDILLTFDDLYVAKRMLWVFLELVAKYHFGHQVPARSVESLDDPGVDARCDPDDNYTTPLVPVPKRKEVTKHRLLDDIDEPLESIAARKAAILEADAVSRGTHRVPGLTRNEVFGNVSAVRRTAFGEASAASRREPNFTPDKASLLPKKSFGSTPWNTHQAPIPGMAGTSDKVFLADEEFSDPETTLNHHDADLLYQVLAHSDLRQYHPLMVDRGLTVKQLQRFRDEDLKHFGITYKEERKRLLENVNAEGFMRRMEDRVAETTAVRQRQVIETSSRPTLPAPSPAQNRLTGSQSQSTEKLSGASQSEAADFLSAGNGSSVKLHNAHQLPSDEYYPDFEDVDRSPTRTREQEMNQWKRFVPSDDSGAFAAESQRRLEFEPDEVENGFPLKSYRGGAGGGADGFSPSSSSPMPLSYSQVLQAESSPSPSLGVGYRHAARNFPAVSAKTPALPLDDGVKTQRLHEALDEYDYRHPGAGLMAESNRRDVSSSPAPYLRTETGSAFPPSASMAAPPAQSSPFASPRQIYNSLVQPRNSPRRSSPTLPSREPLEEVVSAAETTNPTWATRTSRAAGMTPTNPIERQLSMIREVALTRQREAALMGRDMPPESIRSPPGLRDPLYPQHTSTADAQDRVHPFPVPTAYNDAAGRPLGTGVAQRLAATEQRLTSPLAGRTSSGDGGGHVSYQNPIASSSARAPPALQRSLPVDLNALTVDEVAIVIHRLGLEEYVPRFKRTTGALLNTLSKEDIRNRFSGDVEAADLLWNWIVDRRRQWFCEKTELESLL